MEPSNLDSQFVNAVDIVIYCNKSLQIAQRILREIRKLDGKTLQQFVTICNYAKYRGITEQEAKTAFKRVY